MAPITDIQELGPRGKKVLSQCNPNDNMYDQARLGARRWALTRHYAERWEAVRNMQVRPSDIWVISSPKSGTTWTQEMCWILANDCDIQAAKSESLLTRYFFLEFTSLAGINIDFMGLDTCPSTKRRFIKSHLPIEFLPKDLFIVKPKIVYVTRDPRDVVLSYFHHYRAWHQYTGSFDDFFHAFCDDEVLYGPFWRQVLEFWEMQKREDCILFLTYEEMKRDLEDVLRRTADFLGVSVSCSTEELLRHLSFQAMKENAMVNYQDFMTPGESFIRCGESGAWRRVLTSEQCARINQWVRGWLRGTDYPHFQEAHKQERHIQPSKL